MGEGVPATVSIGEAAELLGVHRNTVRNRVKAGRYKAHKVVTPQGETYAIERDSLDVDPPNARHNPIQHGVHYTTHNDAQPDAVDAIEATGQQLALVQHLLAPFVQELSTTKLELGRTQERLVHVVTERDELRAEVELLRAIADAPPTAAETVPGHPARPLEGAGATIAVKMGEESSQRHRRSWVGEIWERIKGG